MKVPCQIAQWYLLPAISAELVKELKKLGVKQAEIARLMGVTPAAISQYVKGKRGKKISFGMDMQKRIALSAKRIATKALDDERLMREMCELCIQARRSKAVCDLHQEVAGIPGKCGVCASG
jgi:uncharacterized protein